MDARLTAISDAVRKINRNLFLLQGDAKSDGTKELIQENIAMFSAFETVDLHTIRRTIEER